MPSTILMRRGLAGPLVGTLLLLMAGPAAARRYPITKSDSTGTWVGTRGGLLHGTGELWKRYGAEEGLPSSRVADLELSTRSVWVATPRGLARLDKGSRRWEVFRAPTLPSDQVTGVSVDPSDPDHVWVATGEGVAHYNVRTNSWTRFGPRSGLPSARINDVLFRGRTVWAATDAGLAAHDTKLGTWTVYAEKDGLAGKRVLEIDEEGSDLWLTCDGGLTRMNLQRRVFLPFRRKEGLPGLTVLSQARMQNLIYFVTDGGLITYDTASDALAPFLHKKGLLDAEVRAVATAGGFVWFATSKGLMRFEPQKKVWEYYRVEDGLSTDDLGRISVAGSYLLVFGAKGGLDTYDYKKDEWVERSGLVKSETAEDEEAAGSQPSSQPSGAATQPAEPEGIKLSVSAELDTELKQDLDFKLDEGGHDRTGYWLVNTLRLGAGAQWGGGRSIDFSGALDWGDISPLFDGDGSTLKSFQKYDLSLRYLGRPSDPLRELIGSTQLRLEPEGGRLTERTELEGGRAVVALGPERRGGAARFATLQVAGGVRRGTPMRVVFRRPDVASVQTKGFKLLKPAGGETYRYVIPSSVRALLDGRELDRNVDYFVDHENGVLWFKNTDLVHAMRVVEVEFEYEQIPRKELGAVSMTDLLPKDGAIGQLKRAGQARWARDEQGLFDEINGGAEQYINRGWTRTLSQDFEWGSAGIILRIHDMGDETNASSIFLVRKLPDAKEVPGLEGVFIEKQTASISIKLVHEAYFIEISIDQATMEQEILSMAGWLVGKLRASGSTAADALRDAMLSAAATLALTDNTSLGLTYIGARSVEDDEVRQAHGAIGAVQDLLALHARHTRKLTENSKLDARLQAAGSSSQLEGSERVMGNGVLGDVLLTSPVLTFRVAGRRYSTDYAGLGVARQTEFCRAVDGSCRATGTSRMDHEVGADATVRPVEWLPIGLTYQRQGTRLGSDYDDAPVDRDRTGTRDIAFGQVGLDRQGIPKLSLGGGYIRRSDALADQGQARANGALEADLAEGWLRGLKFKKLYLRGLYEFGRGTVDEYRVNAADELDRSETMHHAVGELRVAPTLTESGYATLEYHSLRGVLDSSANLVDRLSYWRLDGGAGSSVIPGLAARFESTIWFGDDQPLVHPDPTTNPEEKRQQSADSMLSGVLDLFPGEWTGALSPLKFNVAYTYTVQGQADAVRRGTSYPLGKEVCDNGLDDDGDGLTDCADGDCTLEDVCLVIRGETVSHRVYGTAYWDTPGKLQVELFGDGRLSYSDEDRVLRSTRVEARSYVTWRPIYSSPLTLRFDFSRERKRPQEYDGILPLVEPETTTLEPALEWRRRWSVRWWHLAKLALQHGRFRDRPHCRGTTGSGGAGGSGGAKCPAEDLERLDFDTWTIKPSLEIRRRFEDVQGRWNVRPYLRASYAFQLGRGVASRLENLSCAPGDPCFSDGSETNSTLSVSLGLIWIHSEHVSVDLDLNTSYYDCHRAPSSGTGGGAPSTPTVQLTCSDRVSFSPHLLATVRY